MEQVEQAVLTIAFSSDKKQVLLIKRDDVKLYAFAGGAIDPEDLSAEQAALREFSEETGYESIILRKVCFYTPFGPFSRPTHFFEVMITGGAAKTSSESLEVGFFPLEQLPKNLVPIYHDLIRDALDPDCPNTKPMPRMYWIRDWKFVYNPSIFIPFLWGRVRWWFRQKTAS
jgi:8-oxo-dGTP diphosphatase